MVFSASLRGIRSLRRSRLPFSQQTLFSVLRERIVGIAIQPALPRFSRSNDRMRARARVLARVLVRRRVAAERGAAALTRAQMHPARADLHALLALPRLRVFQLGCRANVGAGAVAHGVSRVV